MKPPPWYLLVHQLPPRPLYLRAKVRQRLARVGALALKNSVYVLPAREECREDLEWIAQEARTEGGEAFVCRAEFLEGVDEAALVAAFRRQAEERYAALADELKHTASLMSGGGGRPGKTAGGQLPRLRKALEEARAVDFFGSRRGKEVEAMLRTLEARVRKGGGKKTEAGAAAAALAGRTWVTRRNVHVDRIATAWLVRRFVDPRARFRFVDADQPGLPKRGELRFDMAGGDFTHEGDRCTFETVVRRTGIEDTGVASIAEIVHDLDLKDDKFGRPEAAGVKQMLAGLYELHPQDEKRLEAGFRIFDGLHAAFTAGGSDKPKPARGPTPGKGAARKKRG